MTRKIFCLLLFPLLLLGQDWTQWRGSERDGYVHDFQVPETWPDALTLQWETTVGEGYGSPVVHDERSFVLTRKDGREIINAVSLINGEVLWQYDYAALFQTNQYALKFGKGPFSTPLISGDKLYALGIGGTFTCLALDDGKLHWQKFLHETAPNVGTYFVGIAMSPIVFEKLVIVHIGDEVNGQMLAFDKDSGEEVWRWSGDRPGYASPIIARVDGQPQLITQSQTSCIGINPSNGELIWQIEFASKWRENIVTPLVIKDKVIVSGVKRGTSAWELVASSGGATPTQAWHSDAVSMYMSSPLLINDLLFGFSHLKKGQFFCVDPLSGKPKWIGPPRAGQNAALVTDGQHIFATMVEGGFLVMKPSAENYDIVAEYTLSERHIWAHPVLTGNNILIKDAESLRFWQIAANELSGEKLDD